MPSKSHAFSTNYHTCIAMPTWHRCAPPILLWPWSPYNLFPRSCLTWIFYVDPHWWVPLCLQSPNKLAKSYAISTNIHAHMINMHTYFVLTSINLICSCFVNTSSSNLGEGTKSEDPVVGTSWPGYFTHPARCLQEWHTCTPCQMQQYVKDSR